MPFPSRAVCLLVLTLACADSGDAPPDAPGTAPSDVATSYAPELGVDLDAMRRTDSGLRVQDVREGTGDAVANGRTAVVHYTGWLPDGTQFDSSRDRNEPFPVDVGAGRVIDGWEEGLVGMKAGGVRRLVIPPHLAYGATGAGGVIPPDATLVFEVELLEIR